MALTSGTRLGPYEIQSPLGAGGMGEVYRAKDTRLDRIVAIKILPTHLSDNPEFKQRFEREARTVSSLNHPHICHLYDVGSQDSTDFLVMEFLDGETLAERLRRGAPPFAELLKIGMEVAEALEIAHRAGILHRDLKPGNIMLTKAGTRLMDFGLAKSASLGATGSASAPLLSAGTKAKIVVHRLEDGAIEQQIVMIAPFDDWHALGSTPDGKAFTFVHNTTGSTQNVYMVSLSGGAPVALTHFASEPVSVPAYAWSKNGKKFAVTRARYNDTDAVLFSGFRQALRKH